MPDETDQQLEPDDPADSELVAASDEELLLYVACKEPEDVARARAAFAVFHDRHIDYLYAACRRLVGLLDQGRVEDLVQLTFLRVWEYAADRFESCTDGDPDLQRRFVRAWLGRIAERLFFDLIEREQRHQHYTLEERDGAQEVQEPPAETPEVRHLRAAVENELSERERDIVTISSRYMEPDGTLRGLPEEVLQYLEAQWSTTRENIRQIRRRALRKLKRVLETRQVSSARGRSHD